MRVLLAPGHWKRLAAELVRPAQKRRACQTLWAQGTIVFGMQSWYAQTSTKMRIRFNACPVRLAVLDVWMPIKSGLEVQALLQVVSPNTKVIVMTGRQIPAIRAAALEGGAFAFLTKPFDDETFLALVRQALGSTV